MKKLLFAVAFLLPFLVKAQTGPYGYKSEDKYLYYSNVIQVDSSFTVSDLYKDSKLFINKQALTNFKVTTDDATNGIVAYTAEEKTTYKTQTGLGSDQPMTIKYNFRVEAKKGRYRYTIDNILVTFKDKDEKGQETVHSLYDLDQDKGGGLIGVGQGKRVIKAMDDFFVAKIGLLTKTMSKRSDDF